MARKWDALMERMMDAMSLERMTDQMSDVCLEKRKVGLMERTMDQLSAMKWKVDLMVTMLGLRPATIATQHANWEQHRHNHQPESYLV